MTPEEQDNELREKLLNLRITVWKQTNLNGQANLDHDSVDEILQLITADRERLALEARIDTATDILYGFSRTYKQEVTDSAGNVYVNESHGYISRYEVQELVAQLKAQQEEV